MLSPCFYRPKYQPKPLKDYSLVEYLLEYYNMYDFEVFLIHGDSHQIGFIKDLRKEYLEISSGISPGGNNTSKTVNTDEEFHDALDHQIIEEEQEEVKTPPDYAN